MSNNECNPRLPITGNYNTYVGARYVPIFEGDWNNTKEYEPLVIVKYQGASYTSKTYVPTGIDILNENYWALTGNYNAQVQAYRQEVQTYREDVQTYGEDVQRYREDVQTYRGDVEIIDEHINTLDAKFKARQTATSRKYIFITDSYGQGDISLPTRIEMLLGLTLGTDCWNGIHGGYGFAASGGTFLSLLQDLSGDITAKNEITDIVVIGGCNDASISKSTVILAIQEFCEYAKENYPNALVSIAMVGRNTGTFFGPVKYAYSVGCGYSDNARYIGGSEDINYPPNARSDNVHPNGDCSDRMARFLAPAILANCDIDFGIEYQQFGIGTGELLMDGSSTTVTPIFNLHTNHGVVEVQQIRDMFNVQWDSAHYPTIDLNGSNGLTIFDLKGYVTGYQNSLCGSCYCMLTASNNAHISCRANVKIANGQLSVYPINFDTSTSAWSHATIKRLDLGRFSMTTTSLMAY